MLSRHHGERMIGEWIVSGERMIGETLLGLKAPRPLCSATLTLAPHFRADARPAKFFVPVFGLKVKDEFIVIKLN